LSGESDSERPLIPPSENSGLGMQPWQVRLPPVLAVIAGLSDVIGLLNFNLFTAHITGNIVVIAAQLVRGGPPDIALILAIPVFIVAVACVWVIARLYRKRGRLLARMLLSVQLSLFVLVLLLSLAYNPAANPTSVIGIITPLAAVSAIASQYALLRLTVPGAPSTAVMTGNTTNLVLSLLDSISRGEPLIKGPRQQLKRTVGALGGFLAGCLAGALAVSWIGNWAWLMPVMVSVVAIALT
jgi:uncharacterized membrane protein YoaK (UPF0700 family)